MPDNNIPNIEDVGSKDNLIPQEVAELSTEEELEGEPYLLSFQKYNNSLCEIDNLLKNCPKRALKDLKTMGRDIFDFKDFNKYGIRTKLIKCDGEYKKLFSRLSLDRELRQHDLPGTARMFYFISEIERVIYVIAFTNRHFETDKVRKG
jgi:hypothetical protein